MSASTLVELVSEDGPFLRVRDVAARLNCSPEWVRLMARRGDLVIRKFGPKMHRVTQKSFDEYLARKVG